MLHPADGGAHTPKFTRVRTANIFMQIMIKNLKCSESLSKESKMFDFKKQNKKQGGAETYIHILQAYGSHIVPSIDSCIEMIKRAVKFR